MKKLLFISLALFVLFGCGKKANPLSPNYGNINNASSANLPTIDSITPVNYGQIADENGDSTDGIQSEIVVVFSDFMDASTINTTNISLHNISDGSDVPLTIDYDAERKTAYITTDNFPDDAGFLFKITNGVHNLGGLPLDGNGNGKQDGAPYDNAIYAFYTGTDASVCSNIRTKPPIVTSVFPSGGSVSVHDTIYIQFGNGPVDTTTFTTQNFHLKKNGTTIVSDSILHPLNPNSVRIILRDTLKDTLERGTMYTFTIDAYQVFAESTALWDTATVYLMRLDANGDGVISADEDSVYTWKFITENFPGTDTATPPQVSNFSIFNTYCEFDFDKTMDASTFTKGNIKVWDSDGYVPGTFRVKMDSTGLKYYYDRELSGWINKAWISMEVMDKYGNKLDGNKNGIGGEVGKDDWHSP